MSGGKLFVSFTALLYALAKELVSQEDLDNGLFCFGATRPYIMGTGVCTGQIPKEVEWALAMVGAKATGILTQVRRAVRRAEQKKTISWRKYGEHRTCTMVNELLERNGYARISGPSETISDPDIASACAHKGLDLVVVHSTRVLTQLTD